MTRILVCGAGDQGFVHRSLNEVNTIYGPVTCVIHANHVQALAWQQAVSQVQITRHLPILENPKIEEKLLRGSDHRDRLFEQGRPNYVVVFESADKREQGRDAKTQYIIYRAQSVGMPVLVYTAEMKSIKRAGSTVAHDEVKSEHPSPGGEPLWRGRDRPRSADARRRPSAT